MAPAKSAKAKGVKRAAPAPAPQEQKKPKVDRLMVGVLDAIQLAGLPQDCQAMLAASVPGCLGTPRAQRHECQALVVTWIGEVVDGVHERLQKAVDAAKAEEATAQQREVELEGHVAEAKVALESVDIESKEQAARAAQAAVGTAEAEVRKGEECGSARRAEIQKLEAALKLLSEDGVQERMQELVLLAQQAGLEESLLVALPTATAKPPSERSTFDRMLVERLETALRERIPVLEAEAVEHKGHMEVAKAAVETATETLQSAREALESAKVQQREAEETLAKAGADKEAFVEGRAGAAAAREEKEVALQNFTGYNVECFTMLRDKAEAGAAA